ncbi:MAG: hypothetical protein PHU07_05815 [Acidocella sp.]|nr:hypothetical protein [Acidocella sp.]
MKIRKHRDGSFIVHLYSTIFHEPWWMEISCAGAQREVSVSAGGMVVGRLPYLLSKRGPGLTTLGMPSMTHVLGPVLAVDFIVEILPASREAIQHAVAKGLVFDMDDGMHVKNNCLPNLLLLTGFGGTIKPRYVVQSSSPVVQMAQRVKELFRERARP